MKKLLSKDLEKVCNWLDCENVLNYEQTRIWYQTDEWKRWRGDFKVCTVCHIQHYDSLEKTHTHNTDEETLRVIWNPAIYEDEDGTRQLVNH